MPIINKLRWIYQKIIFKKKQYEFKNAKAKIELPYRKYKNAKVIIIHDIDNPGFEKELNAMISAEKKNKVKSILMIMPFDTLEYYKHFKNHVGLHETFPYRFDEGIAKMKEAGKKPCSYSQHVAIPATNFYPDTIEKLKGIKYVFVDPLSFGNKGSMPTFFRLKKYKNKLLIPVSGEPGKKEIDIILEKTNKEKGVVAFNFHPDHYFKGDKYFKRNQEAMKHLLSKLR